MKRIIVLAAAILVVCAPLSKAQQQQQPKFDAEAWQKKLTKSDQAIADPKKNTKPATWLDRGKLYFDAYTAPTSALFRGMTEAGLKEKYAGTPKNTPAKFGDKTYRSFAYPDFKVYLEKVKGNNDFTVQAWQMDPVSFPDALTTSQEAYMKAYELDPESRGTVDKVKEGQRQLANYYTVLAVNENVMREYVKSADFYAAAYDIKAMAPLSEADTVAAFNSGFLYTASLEYEKGEKYLKYRLALGDDEDGDIYYYLFHCYNGLKDKDNSFKILKEGIAKFPDNNKILESLMSLYASGMGDPNEVIDLAKAAIEKDPNDASLYSRLALLYEKLGQEDKALETIEQAYKLAPDDFTVNFNYAQLLLKKGGRLNAELNAKNAVGDEYREGLAAIKAEYAKAVPLLETALKSEPDRRGTVETLKNVTLRLKNDSPEMQAKYEKYEKMLEAMPEPAPAQ